MQSMWPVAWMHSVIHGGGVTHRGSQGCAGLLILVTDITSSLTFYLHVQSTDYNKLIAQYNLQFVHLWKIICSIPEGKHFMEVSAVEGWYLLQLTFSNRLCFRLNAACNLKRGLSNSRDKDHPLGSIFHFKDKLQRQIDTWVDDITFWKLNIMECIEMYFGGEEIIRHLGVALWPWVFNCQSQLLKCTNLNHFRLSSIPCGVYWISSSHRCSFRTRDWRDPIDQ